MLFLASRVLTLTTITTPTTLLTWPLQLLFHQKGHGSLPSAFFFVEQLSEGVLKPDGFGSGGVPAQGRATEDEEAEGFTHMYYTQMLELAQAGDPWAAREYDAMLRRERKYCAAVVSNHAEVEFETLLKYGLAGRLSGAPPAQTTFDPEDLFTARMLYPLERSLIACQPLGTHHTQGTERQDGINGVHLTYKGQPFNRSGYGGFPADFSMCLNKDKKQLSMQAEGHASIVHSLPPFSKTHVTQVNASCELQRPDMEEVMYTLEVNTFKDGLLGRNDHAGCGFLFSKMADSPLKLSKGPVALGLRVQDTFRLGAFRVEAVASRATAQVAAAGAPPEVGWGGRAHVAYDHLPGVGMNFDFFQQENKEGEGYLLRGLASNLTYDFEALGAILGVEVDLPGDEAAHVSMSIFSGNDYKFCWLLVIPAWNLISERVAGLFRRGDSNMVDDEGLMDEEYAEGEEEGQVEEGAYDDEL
ncbi:MAG: hypothetical protein WDW36_010304 [Sanguina aurantia]